jgi:hypothetical protein
MPLECFQISLKAQTKASCRLDDFKKLCRYISVHINFYKLACFSRVSKRVARWFIYIPKISKLVYFGGLWNVSFWCTYLGILWSFWYFLVVKVTFGNLDILCPFVFFKFWLIVPRKIRHPWFRERKIDENAPQEVI